MDTLCRIRGMSYSAVRAPIFRWDRHLGTFQFSAAEQDAAVKINKLVSAVLLQNVIVGASLYRGSPWAGTSIVPQSHPRTLDDPCPLGCVYPSGLRPKPSPWNTALGASVTVFPTPQRRRKQLKCSPSCVLSLVESLHQMWDRGLPWPEAAPVAV